MVVKKFLSLCFPLNFHIHYGSSKALFLPSPHGRDTFHGCSVKDDCCCFWRYFCEMYEDLPETSKCFGKYVSTCFRWGNAEILVSPPSVRQTPRCLWTRKIILPRTQLTVSQCFVNRKTICVHRCKTRHGGDVEPCQGHQKLWHLGLSCGKPCMASHKVTTSLVFVKEI